MKDLNFKRQTFQHAHPQNVNTELTLSFHDIKAVKLNG